MSWTAGDSFVRQMGDGEGVDAAGQKSKTIVFKGEWLEILEAKNALLQNDTIETGWLAKTWNTKQIPGGWGELTIECAPPDPTETSGGETTTLPLEDLWSIRSCRNDVSVMAYCGISPGGNPNRADIEMWMKETDKGLYDDYCFKDAEGETQTLSEPSKDLAKKIQKGVQSVMRFYPVLTRKRVYSVQPPACLESLGYIDTPPTVANAKKPGGVDEAISKHQWLKCQDDASQRSDGKWERTESWMGIPLTDATEGDSPWDDNLYGTTNRWAMPYLAS